MIQVRVNVNSRPPAPPSPATSSTSRSTATPARYVLRYTAVQDVGTAIHPSYVEGQIQGGVAQGIGMALNEEYVMATTAA